MSAKRKRGEARSPAGGTGGKRKARVGHEHPLATRFRVLLGRVIDAAPEDVKRVALKERDDGRALTLVLSHANPEVPADPLTVPRLRGFGQKDRLLEKAGGALTVAQAANRLGVSRQAVHKAIRSGRLIAYDVKGGARMLPACQFSGDGILKGLPEVLAALTVTGFWTRMSFLMGKVPELGFRSRIETLGDGVIAPVVEAARRYGEQAV